jgi:hypothetical protein
LEVFYQFRQDISQFNLLYVTKGGVISDVGGVGSYILQDSSGIEN